MGLLSSVYGMALRGHRFLYRSGVRRMNSLPAKVISVGNITLGGTGKTPAVIALAIHAKKRGLKPCILTRGYKGKEKAPCLLSRNTTHFLKTRLVGDEAALMTYRLQDIPVVKGRNRFLAGVFALGELGVGSVNIFILDDGFQHWALRRDTDILLIDATNPFGNERLFPEGILREPLQAIGRADLVVITKSDMASGENVEYVRSRVREYNPHAPVYTAFHGPSSLVQITGSINALESLTGKEVYAFSGIANPSYFEAMLNAQGARIVKSRKFRDHHAYTRRDINRMLKEAHGLDIITTEKDIVKLKDMELPDNIFALRVDFVIDEDFYEDVFRRMNA